MKKAIQTVVMILCGAVISGAQTLIPKAGLTLSTSNVKYSQFSKSLDEGNVSGSSRPGLTIGLAYNIRVGNGSFSLQPELAFIRKGYDLAVNGTTEGPSPTGEGPEIDVRIKQEVKINYLELPVLAKYEFGSDNARFSVYAGPSLGYALGGKTKVHVVVTDGVDIEDRSFDSDIRFKDEPEEFKNDDFDMYYDNRLDLGIQSGVGVTIAKTVAIDVRYGVGLTNLSNDHDSANRVFQFTVGVPIAF